MLHDRTLVRDLSGAICADHHFARQQGGLLHWVSGVYRPDGELLVRQRVKHVLLEHDCSDRWSRALSREVMEFILLDAPELPDRPPPDLINLENGILDIRTRTLLPHSPQFLSNNRVPILYDPGATCPKIDEFLLQVFPGDSIDLAWEILGDLITPDRSIQKAVCLMGEGGTGKSSFLELATRFA